MKNMTMRSLAWLTSLMLVVSIFAGVIVLPVEAATVNYVYSGNYVYNWGTREELATFLSPMAEDFYDENGVTYQQLAENTGASDVNDVPDSDLYDALHKLMYENLDAPTAYKATNELYRYTDCQNSGKDTEKISSFYSGNLIGPDWDGGSTWNKEHTWPNSKSNGGSDSNTQRETDIMMLRPTAKSENGSRSNTAYGESGSFYDPNEESNGAHNLHGDVARIVLYVYVCWGGSDKHDGALDYMWGSSGVMESKDVLLKWMEEDPVDTWELGRNDSVEAITGTRNVFVDYPELAFLLFNEDVPADYDTPSSEGTVPGCAHNYVNSSTTAATCDKDGVKTYTCTLCGGTRTEKIPATGHKLVNGVCSVCGWKQQDVTFTLGADGSASHKDGTGATTYTETVGNYALNIVSGNKMYTGALDAKGNGCIKLGASGATGSFSFTVPNEVSSVVIYIAKYKDNTSKIAVGGETYTLTGNSDDGQYDAIEVDTSVNKTVSLATVSGGVRAMVNTIEYVVAASCSHVYDNACDPHCNLCGEVREPADHVYDNANDATCNVCGAVRQIAAQVLSGGKTSVSEDVKGLAFFFTANVSGAQIQNGYEYVANSASVTPFVGGESYPVVRMGAVVSNGVSSVDIEAKYLWDVTADEASFAIRLINIPDDQLDREITARPYYVYEVDGEEIVVYGDIVSKTYNQAAQ